MTSAREHEHLARIELMLAAWQAAIAWLVIGTLWTYVLGVIGGFYVGSCAGHLVAATKIDRSKNQHPSQS